MKIVLASNNAGKLAELQTLFAPLGMTLVRQSELNIPEAAEPFKTFVENALAKARHAAQLSGMPALADDAGLCVDAFGGQPGVDTAYYATRFGYPKGDDTNVSALLKQMQGITNRRAAMVVQITPARRGSNGFGFDPVMILPEFGKTFAELPPEVKNANSHRGRAAQAMLALMRERWLDGAAA